MIDTCINVSRGERLYCAGCNGNRMFPLSSALGSSYKCYKCGLVERVRVISATGTW